ncbi:alpha/beta fold hydrolase [Shewanella maritima]|uniref:Alpha/beta fold hydrolase n=1 Tax=Shewanella maritima TaxID=2520507 RepID=A0A411PE46_9GAMM|nr:alpha/beta fold hydrolase [Shewanella maritima]QBF81813.1 alpha/beta fold hydrolase [Shewanella maritima]
MTELAKDYVLQGEISDTLIIFAHGAGANMHHEFMQSMAERLVARRFQVLRFNFMYMQNNMADGKRRPPERAPKLLAHYESVLAHVEQLIKLGKLAPKRIVLLGKSMGGRMSSILMSNEHGLTPELTDITSKISHVICLGYPFLPPKGKEPRLSSINDSAMPTLVIQGERDSFGNKQQLTEWTLREGVEVRWLGDGDHSFKPRKSSGYTYDANLDSAVKFIEEYLGPSE